MKYYAKIRFLTRDKGGRASPPLRGYRPHVKLNNGVHTSCVITPQDASLEIMGFGKQLAVTLEFPFEREYGSEIRKLDNIEVYEGSKLVGIGIITN